MADADRPDSDDLDALVRRVDPDRWLSSRFIADPAARADVVALYAYDHELARAPRVVSNPLLGEIRLTWWREALDEIYEGRPVRRHPGAQALAQVVARRALPRESLETLVDARYRELDPQPQREAEAVAWAESTGGCCAELAAAILDPQVRPGLAARAGAAWALSRRVPDHSELAPAFARLQAEARREVRGLSPAAFPAVAHAALAGRRARGQAIEGLGGRMAVTWAVARGRI
jgi:phytoene synthase